MLTEIKKRLELHQLYDELFYSAHGTSDKFTIQLHWCFMPFRMENVRRILRPEEMQSTVHNMVWCINSPCSNETSLEINITSSSAVSNLLAYNSHVQSAVYHEPGSYVVKWIADPNHDTASIDYNNITVQLMCRVPFKFIVEQRAPKEKDKNLLNAPLDENAICGEWCITPKFTLHDAIGQLFLHYRSIALSQNNIVQICKILSNHDRMIMKRHIQSTVDAVMSSDTTILPDLMDSLADILMHALTDTTLMNDSEKRMVLITQLINKRHGAASLLSKHLVKFIPIVAQNLSIDSSRDEIINQIKNLMQRREDGRVILQMIRYLDNARHST